jgi:hypothetical protein
VAAGTTVTALAGIAGAISYSHMRGLAAAHGETGWQAHTFPLSVDGIEIVASLVLLADRRSGRSSGWLPWAALAAGTTASLAANVAAAGADLVGRVVAGWPAFALLVAIKLLSQLLEPHRDVGRPHADRLVPAHQGSPAADAAGGVPGSSADPISVPPVMAANGHRARSTRHADPAETGTGHTAGLGTGRGDGAGTITPASPVVGTGKREGTGTPSDVAGLLPAARVARDRLLDQGEALTRDTLAVQLRHDGHPVRNAKVSRLLIALRQEEQAVSSHGYGAVRPVPRSAGLMGRRAMRDL